MKLDLQRKAFGGTAILHDIALAMEPGERVALIGPSGIGKSTLLRVIAGLDTAFEGRISGAGRLAIAFQEPTLLPWRSVRDNLTLATRCTAAEADTLLAAVGVEGAAERFPGTLSLGQARRVGLARAFAARPETLLLDEPFASLDRAVSDAMQELLLVLLADHPARLILVTHEPREAARLSDRVLRLGGMPATVRDERVLEGRSGTRDGETIDRIAAALG